MIPLRCFVPTLVSIPLLLSVSCAVKDDAEKIESGLRKAGFENVRLFLDPTDSLYIADLSDNRVTTLEPLRGLPIKALDVHRVPFSDLSPLDGMPLKSLIICRTDVSDLSPLRGMELVLLKCTHTKVANIETLRGMPLQVLWISNTLVEDTSALAGMPLTELRWRDGVVLLRDSVGVHNYSSIAGAILSLHVGENF